jgi:TonB-linked SusC/RagA family outer membrane protein
MKFCKILLIMRIATVLILAASLHLSATGHAQQVTIKARNASLEQVFATIRQQTGYLFVYKKDLVDNAAKVDIDVTGASVETVLNLCLKDQPISYTIRDKTVILSPRQPPPTADTPPGEIHGRITGAGGIPLSGANIIIKRLKRGQQTNANGEFVIKNVKADDILIISFIGYKTQNIKVGTGVNFPVVLEEATNELDKVVVQAYGTTTNRLNTGNIATVTAAEIERQPVMNPLIALEGKVPGVIVTETSGYASAPIKVEIRGRSVIDGSLPSEPLYIIDGVPLTVLDAGGGSYAGGSQGFAQAMPGPAGGQSPFFSVNPQDIESITVLKDADATAIYGSRGANGVIIITTKRGKAGKTKLDMNVYQGESVVSGRYDLLNTQQYLMMRREAFKNDQATYGSIPGFTTPTVNNAYDLVSWDTTRYTDWQKIYWSGVGRTTDMELGLSGGDIQNTFRISGAYHHQTSIFTGSGADQRGSVQFNYTHKSLDQRLSFSLTSYYAFNQSDLLYVNGPVTQAPDAPAIFNSEGKLNWSGWEPIGSNLGLWSSLFQPYQAKTGLLNSHLNLQYQVLKGLIFSVELGYSVVHQSNYQLTPISSQYPEFSPKGQSTFSNSNFYNSIIEPQLEYKLFIGKKGKLNVLAGATTQSVNDDGNTEIGTGFINDNLLRSLNSAPIRFANNSIQAYKYGGVFARINYNWADKYLLNLSARRDGSTRFGPGKQFGNFGAVGAAWIFTEEGWFKEHLAGLSFGKVRGSYGITGNDQIGDYRYLPLWTSVTIPYQGIPGYYPTGPYNPDLEWETNHKLEGALDLGFLKDRLTSEIAWYRNRCGNQLIEFPLPYITGFQSVTSNSPALLQNTGWELTLRAKIIEKKDLSWSVNIDAGANRNKLLAYPNLAQSPFAANYVIGQSASIVQLLHYTGVDPQTGLYTYKDKNHNGTLNIDYNNGNNDLYPKDLAVPFDGGFGTDLRYKGFQLSLFFHFRVQQLRSSIYNNAPGITNLNQSVEVLNRWQKPGDHAQFARFTTQPQISDIAFNLSDGVYCNGSFIRLQNASFTYELPGLWVKKTGFQQCILYARGQNLFVLTRYNGIDPDTPALGAMPPSKAFTLGIHFIF